ncbi:MAG TPA: 5-formyltetrahydrofolate cyclo-ligase [Balneolaceae bacterium]
MNLPQSKEQWREQFLNQRDALSLEKWTELSQKVIRRLKQQSVLKTAKTIHCYVSMNERREVNTHPLVKEMIASGKKVVVPVTDFEDGTLSHFELQSFDDLAVNKWGVLEPAKGKRAEVSEIDLVIVPMAGGDESCNRIGYGGGFYDRFLKEVSCPKIGLSFEQNITPKLPVESFDIPLDKIVTEDRVLG